MELNSDGSGVIYKIEKRKNYISRKAPKIKGAGYRGERLEQIIASNIDRFFAVTSIFEPVFNNKTLDRLLVTAESAGIKPSVIINKSDLDPDNLIEDWISLYTGIGYEVFKISASLGTGVSELKKELIGYSNLFFGQSGVGKSSLLNSLYPELELKVGSISSFTDKGTHTTVTSIMLQTDENTFIIDTPGIREIDPFGIRKEDLGHYFPEFGKFSRECRFNTCTHYHEPGCAVIDAVNEGEVSPERYDSYLRILDTIENDIVF